MQNCFLTFQAYSSPVMARACWGKEADAWQYFKCATSIDQPDTFYSLPLGNFISVHVNHSPSCLRKPHLWLNIVLSRTLAQGCLRNNAVSRFLSTLFLEDTKSTQERWGVGGGTFSSQRLVLGVFLNCSLHFLCNMVSH